jgi:hypothetical protein
MGVSQLKIFSWIEKLDEFYLRGESWRPDSPSGLNIPLGNLKNSAICELDVHSRIVKFGIMVGDQRYPKLF